MLVLLISGLELHINGTGFAVLNESYMFRCYVSPTANIRNVVTFTRRGVSFCEIIKPCRVYNTAGYSCECVGVSGNTTVYSLTVSSVNLSDETSWICSHATTDRSNPFNITVYGKLLFVFVFIFCLLLILLLLLFPLPFFCCCCCCV